MDVLRVNFEDSNAPSQFANSLKYTGFAVLENHPIDPKLVKLLYTEWMDFFNNPKKLEYIFEKGAQDGFFPQDISEKAKGAALHDIKEFYQFYPTGQFPEFLSDKTQLLYDQLNKLAATLLDWLEQELPKEVAQRLYTPLSEMVYQSPQTMLRILHYPPLSGDEPAGAVRAAAHEDINILTLLVGATSPGLQVQDNAGKWHDVPCVQNSIAINVGDMLDLATSRYYRSTTHRVINPEGENISRLSMPFFLHGNPDVRLSEDKTVVQYLNERLKELGIL